MGNLIVVGTGIKSVAHLSQETIVVIRQAAKVLFLVNEPLMKEWIIRENKNSQSLDTLYFAYEKRVDAYQAITDYIISENDKFSNLCVVFYGHPTLFASSALQAVRHIRQKNEMARILPAISSIDCLIADLAIDPGDKGCFSADATDFLIYQRVFDIHSHLILWQIASLGAFNQEKTSCMNVLQEYLLKFYPMDHMACLYEASQYPSMQPRMDYFPLATLEQQAVTSISTLYIPPVLKAECDRDMLKKLGMNIKNFKSDSPLTPRS